MKKSSKKGFTLVEVVVTVALFSIVGVLCASLIFIGIRHSQQNSQRSAFQIGVNKFIAIMNEHINSGGNGEVSVAISGDRLEITSKGEKEIYKFNSSQQIVLTQGANEIVVTPYVRDVEFDYNPTKRLLNVKVQSDFDEGWLETSFYIR